MKKRICCIAVSMMIAASGMNSFAAVNFSDVSSRHWAKPFIDKMAEKKIITGYFDNRTLKMSFKPDSPVSYVESAQMIYNTLKATGKVRSNSGLVAKHATTMSQSHIPTWAHEAIAYALEYEIIKSNELKAFVRGETQIAAKKVDVAVFLGRALDMKLEALPVLNFVDSETIATLALPYVDLLEKQGIIKGDLEGKFKPNSVVTRAVMATMCSQTYDVLEDTTTPSYNQDTTINRPSTSTHEDYEGTVQFVSKEAKMIIIQEDQSDTKKSYTLRSVYVKRDGEYGSIEDIAKGDHVKVVFSSNGDIKGIEIENNYRREDGSGVAERIIDYIDESEDMLIVKNDKGDTEVYRVKRVPVRIDGKSADIDDLHKGDRVKLVFKSDRELEKIVADDTVKSMEAKIIHIKEEDRHDEIYTIELRDLDDSSIRKTVRTDEDTKIENDDDDDMDADELVEGMEVYVKYTGNRAVRIEVDDDERKFEGILASRIIYDRDPILKLRTNDGDVKEFKVDEDVDIDRDDGDELYDLEEGDIVSITLEHGKVTEIVSISRSDRKREVDGQIRQITIGSPQTITIKRDEDNKTVTYDIKRGSEVKIGSDRNKKVSDLEIGYNVTLKLDNGKVYKIEADEDQISTFIDATVQRNYESFIIVRYFDEIDHEYREINVLTDDDTDANDVNGDDIALRNLDEDDKIIVYGRFEDDRSYRATRILRVRK